MLDSSKLFVSKLIVTVSKFLRDSASKLSYSPGEVIPTTTLFLPFDITLPFVTVIFELLSFEIIVPVVTTNGVYNFVFFPLTLTR